MRNSWEPLQIVRYLIISLNTPFIMMPVNHCSLTAGRLMTTINIKTNKHLNLTKVSFSSFI